MSTVSAKAWLIVEGKTGFNYATSKHYLKELRVVGSRVGKPELGPLQEAIEITIELPADYFNDQNPKINVVVPPRQSKQASTTVQAQVKPKAPSAAAAIIHGS